MEAKRERECSRDSRSLVRHVFCIKKRGEKEAKKGERGKCCRCDYFFSAKSPLDEVGEGGESELVC